MLQPLSQVERAFRDTQVHRADGQALVDLSTLVGLPQPRGYSEAHWRDALQAGAYAPRTTPGVVKGVFEKLLQGRQEDVVVTLNPATPTTLTYVSGLAAGGFTRDHVGRIIRVVSSLGDHVVWSTGPDFVAVPGGISATLTIADIGTVLWQASPYAGLGVAEDKTATVLPFLPVVSTPGPLYTAGVPTGTSEGRACALLMLVRLATVTPPTYLQPTAAARPATQPFGGHLQPNATYQGNPAQALAPGPDVGLPHGLYLAGDADASLTLLLDRLVASGVHGTVRATDFSYRLPGIWE